MSHTVDARTAEAADPAAAAAAPHRLEPARKAAWITTLVLVAAGFAAAAGADDTALILVCWQWAMSTIAAGLGVERSPYIVLIRRSSDDHLAEPDVTGAPPADRTGPAVSSLALSAAFMLFTFGAAAAAWTLVGLVAAAAATLAATGVCVACRTRLLVTRLLAAAPAAVRAR